MQIVNNPRPAGARFRATSGAGTPPTSGRSERLAGATLIGREERPLGPNQAAGVVTTIQDTPKRSATMPKRGEKKVRPIGI